MVRSSRGTSTTPVRYGGLCEIAALNRAVCAAVVPVAMPHLVELFGIRSQEANLRAGSAAYLRTVSAREAILISVGSEGCWEGHGNTNGGLRLIER